MRVLTTECCGIREIDGLQNGEVDNAREALLEVVPDLIGERDGAFSFFSTNQDSDFGHDLAEYIMGQNLGSVYVSDARHNPNSENDLTMFVWTMDLTAMTEWLARETAPAEVTVDVGNGVLRVGGEVLHQTYGLGIIRAIRGNGQARIGVEFLNNRAGQHNLDGAIEGNRGMWTNATRLTLLQV